MEKVGNGLIKHHRLKFNMQSHKRIIAPGLILMMLASTLLSIAAPVQANPAEEVSVLHTCLLYTSPSPRDATLSRMPSSA